MPDAAKSVLRGKRWKKIENGTEVSFVTEDWLFMDYGTVTDPIYPPIITTAHDLPGPWLEASELPFPTDE